MTEKRFHTYNIIALLCAIWFILFGGFWAYFANLIFAYPVAILGFFLWRKGRGAEKKLLNKIVGWMLVAGIISSFGVLVILAIYN